MDIILSICVLLIISLSFVMIILNGWKKSKIFSLTLKMKVACLLTLVNALSLVVSIYLMFKVIILFLLLVFLIRVWLYNILAPLYLKVTSILYFFDKIFNSISSQISGWKSKLLSMGAWLILIKSVLCSMPIYFFQTISPTNAIMLFVIDWRKDLINFFGDLLILPKIIHWTN